MMKLLIVILLGLAFTSCASVQILDKDKNPVGYTFHSPKPYLLIERKVVKDTLEEKVTLVYLPDLANPRTIRITPGLGSANFAINFEKGMLKSISAGSDAKVPEVVGAASGFLPGGAALYTALKAAKVTAPLDGVGQMIDGATAGANEAKLPRWELFELLVKKEGQLVLKKVEFGELSKDQKAPQK